MWPVQLVISKVCRSVSSIKTVLSRCVPKSLLPSHLQSENPGTAGHNYSPVLLISLTRSTSHRPNTFFWTLWKKLSQYLLSAKSFKDSFQGIREKSHREKEKAGLRWGQKKENSGQERSLFPRGVGSCRTWGSQRQRHLGQQELAAAGGSRPLFWSFVTAVKGGTCLPRL